jgi:LytS/YehU family sensor histidine kinase
MNFPATIKTGTLNLRDVVDITALQRIQDTFSTAMGVAVVTVDRSGKPITKDSNFRRICLLIRSTDYGLTRCMQCDADGGLEARYRKGPFLYTCKGGMLDIAAPIIIQGELIGSVLCGQVVPNAERDEHIEDVVRRNANLGLSIQDVRLAAQEIPSMPRDRVDAAGEMLFQMSNYIAEMGVANLAQKKLLEQTKERADLQSALHDAQLRMLQSQISPHFLFNALGLIGYTALQENASQTEHIAYALSDLLRYSLRNITAEVTLGQEMDIIQHYLSIQKLRFHSRLEVKIEIDPSLKDARIPCMIIQPLVENAIVHSVESLSRPVTVTIRAQRVDNGIQLEIIDDGVGMDPSMVSTLRMRTFLTDTGRLALGIKNVIQRLELAYGNRFDFQIESEAGHGTHIKLYLPIYHGK